MRDSKRKPAKSNGEKEIVALMFVMVEQSPGAYRLRFVQNEELIQELRQHGVLQEFLADTDELYADFRSQIENSEGSKRPN